MGASVKNGALSNRLSVIGSAQINKTTNVNEQATGGKRNLLSLFGRRGTSNGQPETKRCMAMIQPLVNKQFGGR